MKLRCFSLIYLVKQLFNQIQLFLQCLVVVLPWIGPNLHLEKQERKRPTCSFVNIVNLQPSKTISHPPHLLATGLEREPLPNWRGLVRGCVTFCQYQALVAQHLANLLAKSMTKRFSIGIVSILAASASTSTNVSTGGRVKGFCWIKKEPFKRIQPDFQTRPTYDMTNSTVLCWEMVVFSWTEGRCVWGLKSQKGLSPEFRATRLARREKKGPLWRFSAYFLSLKPKRTPKKVRAKPWLRVLRA